MTKKFYRNVAAEIIYSHQLSYERAFIANIAIINGSWQVTNLMKLMAKVMQLFSARRCSECSHQIRVSAAFSERAPIGSAMHMRATERLPTSAYVSST